MQLGKSLSLFLLVLAIALQPLAGFSAPCPMNNPDMGMSNDTVMMDHSQHDMSAMIVAAMDESSSEAEDCCAEDSCPMNTCAAPAVFNAHQSAQVNLTANKMATARSELVSSDITSLYRPPITA